MDKNFIFQWSATAAYGGSVRLKLFFCYASAIAFFTRDQPVDETFLLNVVHTEIFDWTTLGSIWRV